MLDITPTLHICLNACHTRTGGGLTYLRELLPEFAQLPGFQYTLVVQDTVRQQLEIPAGMTVQTAPDLGFWGLHWWEQFTLPRLCRQWGVDVTWCNANFAPVLAPLPVVTVHNNPLVVCQTWRQRMYWWQLRWVTRVSVWRSRASLSVAGHILPAYFQVPWQRLRRKIRIAPPGVRVQLPEVQLPPDANLIVAIGDIYPQKRYGLLLQALKYLRTEMPKARLQIIGHPVDAAEFARVQQHVAQLQLADAVTFTGRLPHAETLLHLRHASVLCSVAQTESFNIPVLEAMAVGTPVVMADTAAPPEMVQQAVMSLDLALPGDNAAALATALLGMLSLPSLQDRFRRLGKLQAEKFTWPRTAATIAATWREVAQGISKR